MKTLKEALFSRKNLNSNPFRLTKYDLKGAIKYFPMGVVVRMMEEQELQGNEPDVKVFQEELYSTKIGGGFDWEKTEAGDDFWDSVLSYVIKECDFDLFFKKYPEYARYNLA